MKSSPLQARVLLVLVGTLTTSVSLLAQTKELRFSKVESVALSDRAAGRADSTSLAVVDIDAPSVAMQERVPAEVKRLRSTPSSSTVGQSLSGRSSGTRRFDFPSFHERQHKYLYDLVGPGAFLGAAISAAVDQTHSLKVAYPPSGYLGPGKHPEHGAVPEWGEGGDGFGKRYASNFGMGLVGTTTRYGLGEILRQDVTYHPCQCSGFLPRTVHAVEQSFVAHTRSGRSIPSIPAIVAPFVAAEVGTAGWYPARYNSSDALRTSSTLYISLPVKNLISEFTGR